MAAINATNSTFTTIRAEGALLPPDLLRRIAENDASLDGLTPDSYHLPGQRLTEAINQHWNTLLGVWASFKAAREALPESDLGTTLTRERWLLPLFRELDYGRLPVAPAVEIDGRSYPISHQYAYNEAHVPVHLVSSQIELDKRTPGVAGAASASPHSLVQVFLNRSDDNLWGFVSNGLRLRVLRDNATLTRQAYLEFDLEAMMDGEVYSDFVLLWLICHQSRVEGGRDCWLERWARTAQEQETRALDQLRDGVQAAIEALGAGFLDHPANTALRDRLQSGALTGQDYYRQLLRVVYRLVVLFVAEDRDLLYDPAAPEAARQRYRQHYSTRRLRQIAQKLKGTRHTDLYESLRLVMRLLSGENGYADQAALLGLPVLGSFLFSDRAVPDVIDCRLANAALLDAVRSLAFTTDRAIRVLRAVDYKNLGPEELGSVYESLLELHPRINVDAHTFALATAGGNERKTTGSYYTPTSLIDALLDSALDPVIQEAISPRPVAEGRGETVEQRLLALTVCDPACGSGHFLIAAAHRIARALATARTGEEAPSPDATREALRDVIGHCIFGIDINPMAVELCKVNLWLEALEPGKPLSFLEHRIKQGNSLLGTTPALMAQGILDDAFNPIEGDDKKVVSAAKKLNRDQRKQREAGVYQRTMFAAPPADYAHLSADIAALDALDDDTLAGIREKEARYQSLADDAEYQKARGLADAWCAAFVWEKTETAPPPLTDLIYRQLEDAPLSAQFHDMRAYVVRLAEQYEFFHWHVEFPTVFEVPDDVTQAENEQTGWNGGFSCVLGNPPWERIKIQEKEWFAERSPEIAAAAGANRKRLIEQLEQADPQLWNSFNEDQHKAMSESHLIRQSSRYPLTGRGDINTYPLFVEISKELISNKGQVGLIVPSGIATDDTTKDLFRHLMETQSLISLYDFENRDRIFPGVYYRFKFCLLTFRSSTNVDDRPADFAFFLFDPMELADEQRKFKLSATDIALLNPYTRTCPVFRNRHDAQLAKTVYSRLPVLGDDINSWQVELRQGLFHSSGDSALFLTPASLKLVDGQRGLEYEDSTGTRYIPFIEPKMFGRYDHRAASIVENTSALQRASLGLETTLQDHLDPYHFAIPRLCVPAPEVAARYSSYLETPYCLGYRRITSPTNERTMVAAVLPFPSLSENGVLLLSAHSPSLNVCLLGNLNSFVFDYFVRQKSGLALGNFVFKQLPAIPPEFYTPTLINFIASRVLELSYTAWDLAVFAEDLGYTGSPFRWESDRRFCIHCELDAMYFHLYSLTRKDTEYVMETFWVVRDVDERSLGDYRTKRTILEMYDAMAALGVDDNPDAIAGYVSRLDPPPGDIRAAHKVG